VSQVLLDAAGRPRSPAALPGYHAGRPPRNKGQRYPANRHRDRRRHAPRRQRHVRRPSARAHHHPLARRPAHPRSPRARRSRPRPPTRFGAGAPRQGRPSPRGRHGRLGLGTTAALAHRPPGPAGRPAAVDRHRTDTRTRLVARRRPHRTTPGRRPGRRATTCRAASAAPRARCRDGPRGRAADRHPTPARGIRTSGSPRSTCRASTAPRSSTPSTAAAPGWSRSTRRFACNGEAPRCSSSSVATVRDGGPARLLPVRDSEAPPGSTPLGAAADRGRSSRFGEVA
jgi:hypothetical protein